MPVAPQVRPSICMTHAILGRVLAALAGTIKHSRRYSSPISKSWLLAVSKLQSGDIALAATKDDISDLIGVYASRSLYDDRCSMLTGGYLMCPTLVTDCHWSKNPL